MRMRVCGFTVLLLAFAASASAQIVAGSPEDNLFQQITAADSLARKVELGQQFEAEFPGSPTPVLVSVYTLLMNAYEQQQEYPSAVEYGEKIVAKDPENVNAYMALCRYLSVNLRDDLSKAVEYGERAVSLAEGLKDREPPSNYTPEQWEAYTRDTENYAQSILSYARTIRSTQAGGAGSAQ